VSSRIPRVGIIARLGGLPLRKASAPAARPSIICWRQARSADGIVSIRTRSGTGMAAGRYGSPCWRMAAPSGTFCSEPTWAKASDHRFSFPSFTGRWQNRWVRGRWPGARSRRASGSRVLSLRRQTSRHPFEPFRVLVGMTARCNDWHSSHCFIGRRYKMRRLATLIAPIAAAVLAVGISTVDPGAAETVSIAHSTWVGYGPLYIARDKGFFSKNGVDVDLIVIEDPKERFPTLMADKIQMIASTVDTALLYMKKPDDFPICCGDR